jgi:hypothetical protein
MMPHAPGTYLGGIRTLEDLRERCVIDADTGCWHWRMAITQGAPRVHLQHPQDGRKVTMRGRRAALLLATGRDLPRGHTAYARHCCQADDCVNPEHSRSGNRREHGQWLTKSGKVKNLLGKRAASRRGWDTRGRKVTPEMRQDILNSTDEPWQALADRLGVSKFVIYQVRKGLTHSAALPGASVFNWRP